VKLLFDQNLSPQLVKALADHYPESIHVRDVGLSKALDKEVWDYASQNGLTIITKDSDFHQRSFLLGQPPKVVWVCRGNCSASEIETILRTHHKDLQWFEQNTDGAFLILE